MVALTAPVLDKPLPVRVPGRALAALEAKYPQHVEDAPLTAAEIVAVLANFRTANRCPDCEGIVLDGHTHGTTSSSWWVDVYPHRFDASTSMRARDWFEQYTARSEHTAYPTGMVRFHCAGRGAAHATRDLLLGFGLPQHLVIVCGGAS